MSPLRWRHNDHDGVSNHLPRGCLLNRLFRSKKTSKLRVTGLCEGNSPGPVNSPHKGPVTRKMFPFDDVIMTTNNFHSLVQDCSNSSALAMELLQSCNKPLILSCIFLHIKSDNVSGRVWVVTRLIACKWDKIDLVINNSCLIACYSLSEKWFTIYSIEYAHGLFWCDYIMVNCEFLWGIYTYSLIWFTGTGAIHWSSASEATPKGMGKMDQY